MYTRIKAALAASNLLDTYEQQFEENALDDSMVDNLLASKEYNMSFLKDVIQPAGHRLKFTEAFSQLSNSSSSASSLSQHQDSKKNVHSQEILGIDDDADDSGTFLSQSSTASSQGSTFSSKNSHNGRPFKRKFKKSVNEAYDTALNGYVDKMDELLSKPDVSYDNPHLESIHETTKGEVLTTFIHSYKLLRMTEFEVFRLKKEACSQADIELKMEEKGQEVDKDLSNKQMELVKAMDQHFKSLQDKIEFEHLKARNAVGAAEKLYNNQMTEYLDTCLDEFDLLVKEAQIKEEAIKYLNDHIRSSIVKFQFINQLNIELNQSISSWFKTRLELFRLKKDEEEVILQMALITAKAYYNDEMKKNFQSKVHMKPSTLAQIDEQISSAAINHTMEQHKELKTQSQQAQLKEALKNVFKKYDEENLLRKPTKSPAIGIDLGTTHSCVAVVIDGKPVVIRNENGHNTTPSYVSFEDDGSVVTGYTAKDLSYRNSQNTVFDSKRLIGRDFDDPEVQENLKVWPFKVIAEGLKPKIKISINNNTAIEDSNQTSKRKKLDAPNSSRTKVSNRESAVEKTYHPEEISAHILKKMKQIAEDYLGTKVESAVVTVPALFNDSQRQATKDAAEIAGLKVLRIINEPTAAAIAYRLNRLDDFRRNVLVFDLGGGTFDVSVLKITGGKIEVQAVHGDTHLGGEDFDEKMIKTCIDHFQAIYEVDLAKGKTSKVARERSDASNRLRRIRNECEKQKKNLSSTDTTKVVVESIYVGHNLEVPFTREKFESINQKYFDKCITIVGKVLKEAKMSKSEIDDIVLVGGSTRIPKIQKMLSDFFGGKALSKTINPDEAVAVGAAIQACILNGNPLAEFEKSPLKLIDVTPLSIGIKNFDRKFNIQIPKNTKIPCEHTEIRYISKDFCNSMELDLYEGENLIASKNHHLGMFYLDGIPMKKARKEEVEVTTSINENGILSVKAVCLSNNVTNQIKIISYKDRLTRQEIEDAQASMQ